MLSAVSISKRFGTTVALADVSFEARAGEIHALLGENGAGKTTLMNIFSGRFRPDAGTVRLDGKLLKSGSPHAALEAGVATVHQSSMLFERLTWEENLALGGFGLGSSLLDLAELSARARALAEKLGFSLPPGGSLIEQRSVTERVRLEVLRALSFNPRVLILDEPTSVLAPAELGAFLASLTRLRAEGRIVILITHKLGEALAVSDRITVLREGKVVACTTPCETGEAELGRLMVGEVAAAAADRESRHRAGEAALEIEDLTLEQDAQRVLERVNLVLRRGEIVGLAGVDGNGQTELVELLAGMRRPTGGRVRIFGAPLAGGGERRLAVIPQDRDLDGLILDMELWENLMLSAPLRAQVSVRGWLGRRSAVALCRELMERFKIRASGPAARVAELSGGNRQRLEVARALGASPAVLVAHNLCRGLDIAATAEVHRELRQFAAAGGAVLLVSSDLDELLALGDRLAVISAGRVRETSAAERNPERLGMLMAGAWR